ncbi:type IV secretion protein Rhs, partial [Gilliamella apicola]
YDAQGRITAISDGQNQTISYTYDSLGQVTQLTYPNKTTREYRYNAYGKVTWFKDESGKVTEYEYASPLHLVTEKRLPNGERLKFRYDNVHVQMSEIENQKGEVYHLNYTPTGQLSEEIGFDGIRTTYHYDNAGRIIEKREYGNTPDAEPLVTQYQRDITGRLVRRIFADGVIEQYEYDAYGQLIKVKDGQNILVWEYNLDGQMTAEHQNWATIRHRYDKTSGLLDGTKLPDGQWLEYHHRNGQLRGMTLEGQSLIGMFYDSAGRERERRQGNGLINRYHYDELGQLASHQIYRGFDVELNDTPLPVWQQQHQYEPDGQLAQINGNQARHYRYDKLGQLQTVSYPQANREEHHAEKVELFSYDTTGNKISEKQSLAQLEAKVNRGNRLLFFSDKHFEYDRFGNLITEKRGKNQSLVTHYEYDCRHRLIKVIKPSGQTITYSYDPFNRRTSKTVNGKTTEFIWQGHKLIAETDNDKHWQSYLYEQDS